VEAVYPVVLDAQISDAGTRALARFEIEQKAAAVVLDRAQLVERFVIAVGNDTALAHERARLGFDRARQQLEQLRPRRERLRQLRELRTGQRLERGMQLRQHAKRLTQAGEIARPGAS